ncbi:MAG TPA: T9SS type A sorting domain-containing protein [Flavipsychrobacter sp.]
MKATLLLSSLLLTSAIATQAQLTQRLIGTHQAHHTGTTWQPTDTVQLKYAPGNGNAGGATEYEAGTLKFDTLKRYSYTGSGYMFQYQSSRHYNAAGLMDSSLQMYNMGGTLVNSNLDVFRYDGGGRDTAWYMYSWNNAAGTWMPQVYKATVYGLTGSMIVTTQYADPVTGVLTNSTRDIHSYIGANLTSIENEVWDAAGGAWVKQTRTNYTYDINNNNDTVREQLWDVSTSAYIDMNLQVNTYNTLNKLTLTDYYSTGGSGWQLVTQYKYLYDGANRLVGDTILYADFIGNIYPSTANRYLYNAMGRVDTTYNVRWTTGGVVIPDSTRMYTTYNSLGQITRRASKVWDVTALDWIEKGGAIDQKFWYEVTTGIDNKPGSSIAGISLYPNPAGSFVNIDVKMERQQPYTVSIYNTTGSLLRQWEEKGSNSRMISTADLQAGNYIVTIRSGNDVQSAQFVIAR